MTTGSRTQIFVSYSHVDREYLARLKVHLRPFERENLVEVWSDTKIHVGQDWRKEIQAALDRSAAAILLISADFLASDFIANKELPHLLDAAKNDGLRIIPVILKPCAFTDIKDLSMFHCINDPEKSVIALNEAESEKLWYDVALAALDSVKKSNDSISVPPPRKEHVATDSKTSMLDDTTNYDLLGHNYLAFFHQELRDPSVVDDYLVYQYHHIDTLAYMLDAETILKQHASGGALIKRIKSHLRNNGWEGDGVLQLLWLPPFIGAGIEDTWGVCVWHVKQYNNGTSWLASPVPLEFGRLAEQNWQQCEQNFT
jgi:hypothetical protein